MRLEELGKLKHPMTSWGVEPANVPACSTVQSIAMLRAAHWQ
jgi:hypothetical protein